MTEKIPTCEPEEFRTAMRKIASSVAVITSHARTGPVGITATSAVSVSMSPPSILICVNKATRLHDAVLKTQRFRVNYLADDQADVARAFGGMFEGDRFSCGQWLSDTHHGPHLDDSLCSFACALSETTSFGTHSVFIGIVSSASAGRQNPLMYCNGNFLNLPDIQDV